MTLCLGFTRGLEVAGERGKAEDSISFIRLLESDLRNVLQIEWRVSMRGGGEGNLEGFCVRVVALPAHISREKYSSLKPKPLNAGGKYEGWWLNDCRHGHGKMEMEDRTVYEGEWKDDMRNGQGKQNYLNGQKYEV